jgi:hypothetical protein
MGSFVWMISGSDGVYTKTRRSKTKFRDLWLGRFGACFSHFFRITATGVPGSRRRSGRAGGDGGLMGEPPVSRSF